MVGPAAAKELRPLIGGEGEGLIDVEVEEAVATACDVGVGAENRG